MAYIVTIIYYLPKRTEQKNEKKTKNVGMKLDLECNKYIS